MSFNQDGTDPQAWRTHHEHRLHYFASPVELNKIFPQKLIFNLPAAIVV